MKNTSYYADLIEERDRVIKELAHENPELSGELKIILKLIEKYRISKKSSPNTKEVIVEEFKPNTIEIKKTTINRVLKPTQIIRKVFDENPDKTFSPPEIRDLVQECIDKGLTIVKGKKLLVTAHTIIRVLLKQGFIEKIQEDENIDPVYKRKIEEMGNKLF